VSKKSASVTFSPGLGHVEELVANGRVRVHEDGSLIVTDLGIEILLAAPARVSQEERACEAEILCRLAEGPKALHELPGDYEMRRDKLKRFRADGLVDKLDDKFVLTAKGLEVAPARDPAPVVTPVCPWNADIIRSGDYLKNRPTLSLDSVLRPGDRTDGNRWAVLAGGVFDRLRDIQAACVDIVVTSPPYYKYRDYGEGQMGNEATPELYVEGQVRVLLQLKEKIPSHGLIVYVIQDKILDRKMLGLVHDIIAEVKKFGLFLCNEAIWAKDACLANSSGSSLTMAHEFILMFAKSEDYYWSAVMSRELGGLGVMRNGHSVQRFSRAKEWWQEGHDATFPPDLVHWALRCGASRYGRCYCGEPWEDVLTREVRSQEQRDTNAPAKRLVTGAAPRCGHDGDPEPILILDPFCGTATTGMVGLNYGKARFIGIESQPKFVEKSAVNLGTISPELTTRRKS